jgi:hypothetical protein
MFTTLAFLLVFVQFLSESNNCSGHNVISANTITILQKSKSVGHTTLFGETNLVKAFPPVSSEYLTKSPQRFIKSKGKTCTTYKNSIVQHPLQQISARVDTRYLVHSIFSNCLYLLYGTLLI